jgi:hypothetical protein
MELPMQPLDTYHLILNYIILIMMPLIIWANLRMNPNASPVSAYLWNEHPNFMRISLVVIGLLVVFSAVSLLGHYGVLSGDTIDAANIAIAIPFLVLAVVEIVLGVRLVLKFLRDRKTKESKI